MKPEVVEKFGKRFVLVEESEYQELCRLHGLPLPPRSDANGNVPAVEFAKYSIATSIADERMALGLSRDELAKLAGVRRETIDRAESGQHTPNVKTVEKIDTALKRAAKLASRRQSKPKN